jgi:hypothetical protein
MKKTRTIGYLRQLLHLNENLLKTNKTVRDLQLQGEKLRTIRNTRRTKHSHSNTKHFQYFLPYTT